MSGLGTPGSDRPRGAIGALSATVAALAVMAGATPLLGRSPAALAVALAGLAGGAALILRPRRAVQCAVLSLLLPAGLLPATVQFALSAAAVVVATLAVGLDTVREPRPVRAGPAVVLLLLFLVWSVVTLLWTPQPAAAFDLLRRYAVLVLLLLLVVNGVTSRRDAEGLLDTLALAGWLVIVVSFWELLTHGYAAGSRLGVLGLNDNQVGNILLLMAAGVLWRAVRPGRSHPRRAVFAAYAYLALSLVVIALTGSRGSIIGFAALLVALAFFRPLRQIAAVAAVAGVCTAVLLPGVFATVAERFTTPTGELSRSTLWSAGIALAADHPLGVGPANGPVVMRDYIDARVSTDYFKTRDSYPAHNPLIEVADDMGLPGLTLYAAALLVAAGMFLAEAQRARRRGDPSLRRMTAVIGAVSVPFLLVWGKSGGSEYHITAFLLVALWLLPGLVRRARAAEARAGWGL